MTALSVRDFRSQMARSFNRVDAGEQVFIRRKNQLYTIVPIEDVGDVNGNGMIDIADVTELIDQLLTGEFTNIPYSDIDLDGSITISDITELIDRLLTSN